MTSRNAPASAPPRAPAVVRLFDPIGRLLLRAGAPMGPDRLLTVRGRTSGVPRTVGVAVVEFDGRRFVIGTYGAVHWVRNLRASTEAVIRHGSRSERVRAVELDHTQAAEVLRGLAAYVRDLPWYLRAITLFMLRFGKASEVLTDPSEAARTRPVFELYPTR